MTRVIVLQHYGCETLGAIADALQHSQVEWTYFSLADRPSATPDIRDAQRPIVLGEPFSVYLPERYPFVRRELELIQQTL